MAEPSTGNENGAHAITTLADNFPATHTKATASGIRNINGSAST